MINYIPDGYLEYEPEPTPSLDVGLEKFLMSFVERAIKDYKELDPTSHKRSSEFSDNHVEFQEWKTAADFIFNDVRVMHPWNVTFDEICDLLDMNADFLRERIRAHVGEK